MDKVIELKPSHLLSYYNRGYIKTELKMYADAIPDFDKAIELYPDFGEAYYLRSLSKRNLNKIRSAEIDYQVAMAKLNAQNNDSSLAIMNSKKYTKIIELEADFNSSFAGSDSIFSVYSGIDPIADFDLIFSKAKELSIHFNCQEISELKGIDENQVKLSNISDSPVNYKILQIKIDSLIKANPYDFELFLYKGLISRRCPF